MIYMYIGIYIFILLIGLAAIVTEEEVRGKVNRTPLEYAFALHFGFVGLLFVAIHYLFKGRSNF